MKFLLVSFVLLTACGHKDDDKPLPAETVTVEALPVETSVSFAGTTIEATCPAIEEFFTSYTAAYLDGLSVASSCEKTSGDVFTEEDLKVIKNIEPIACKEDRDCFKTVVTFDRGDALDRYFVMVVRLNGQAKSVIFSDDSNAYFLPVMGPEVPKGKLLHDKLSHLRRSLEAWLQE